MPWTRRDEGGCQPPPQPCNEGDRAPTCPAPSPARCIPASVCRPTSGAGTWPPAGAVTRRGTAGEREKGLHQSLSLGHSPEPSGFGDQNTPNSPRLSCSPSTVPIPALTFSPSAVRMLSALGTRRAVLVFLRTEMEVTGTTACTRGARQCHRVPGCCLCPPPEPLAPRLSPAHLDVLEQEAGVEADVAGGDVEAAMVGYLSLPGTGEAGQQCFPLGELPEGFAVTGGTLAQLRGRPGRGAGVAWCSGQSPGTTGTPQPPTLLPPLPQNQDGPSLGTHPAESIPPGPRCWGWGPPSCAPVPRDSPTGTGVPACPWPPQPVPSPCRRRGHRFWIWQEAAGRGEPQGCLQTRLCTRMGIAPSHPGKSTRGARPRRTGGR